MKKNIFSACDILLPKFRLDGDKMKKYSVIACDQFTSEIEYWDDVRSVVSNDPSTLDLILPEVYLNKTEELVPVINGNMEKYKNSVFDCFSNSMIYCERTLPSNGKVRHGIIGLIDLCDYEFTKGAQSLIRSSEGTVKERIPPRVKVREGACLELPHVMLFVDDEKDEFIGAIGKNKEKYDIAYNFDLMLGCGNIKGFFIDKAGVDLVYSYIDKIADKTYYQNKYKTNGDPLVFTVGDGNHSLATAKVCFEKAVEKYGEKAYDMPCRYALVEVVNIHDEAIEFEPIYRLVKNCSANDLINALKADLDVSEKPTDNCFRYDIIDNGITKTVYINAPKSALPVGEIQEFLDRNCYDIDYIHGIDSINALSKNGCVGIVFEGMKKSELFPAVIKDGALPRKTFSMGEAKDKRFYLEARKIK